MAATDVVAYTYQADTYHPACVLRAMGYTQRTAERVDVETELDELARERRIYRHDESSYDSDDFPKVIFESDLEPTDEDGHPYVCGVCQNYLDENYVPPQRHWVIGAYLSGEGRPGDGAEACFASRDQVRDALIDRLTAHREAMGPCPHADTAGAGGLVRCDTCGECRRREWLTEAVRELREETRYVLDDNEPFIVTVDMQQPATRTGLWVQAPWNERSGAWLVWAQRVLADDCPCPAAATGAAQTETCA